ncbi:MAG: hypothetical protein AAGE65_00935, partial [Planctomycetota bacterium]
MPRASAIARSGRELSARPPRLGDAWPAAAQNVDDVQVMAHPPRDARRSPAASRRHPPPPPPGLD